MWINGNEILITGGTGSLGRVLAEIIAKEYKPRGIRIFSRDEQKHWDMQNRIKKWKVDVDMAFIIGDVRDKEAVRRASEGVDVIIHTAAMKHIPACEENPLEAEETNVNGAINIINAAIRNHSVKKVMNICTDKACYPINYYGVTKANAEKLFIKGNVYSRGKDRIPRFSSCRYGNILGSRGSVIQLFREQAKTGKITITDPNMTRFWVTLAEVVRFILYGIENMIGGEIFVPDIPSCTMQEFADIVAPGCKREIIGKREGEKIHEHIITEEESEMSAEFDCSFGVIRKGWRIIKGQNHQKFSHTSKNNPYKLTREMLEKMLREDEKLRGEKWIKN
jgi:UDP-N-acetylglucosamine 4,6-dehydratase